MSALKLDAKLFLLPILETVKISLDWLIVMKCTLYNCVEYMGFFKLLDGILKVINIYEVPI